MVWEKGPDGPLVGGPAVAAVPVARSLRDGPGAVQTASRGGMVG